MMLLQLLPISIGAALLAPLAAQDPGQSETTPNGSLSVSQLPNPTVQPQVLGADLVPIHTAEPDDNRPYGLWGAGDRYKASFHGDVTFVPYLGGDYPRTQHLAWRTESVTVGQQELVTGAPERWHDDYRFEVRFGGVTEAYDVLVDGLEQTFVLHRDPGVRGDLVVIGRLQTELTARRFADQHRAIPFVDAEGRHILTYGAGTVVDADDRRAAVLTSYDGERITLRVAGSWLANARYPVVLDPLVSSNTINAGVPRHSVDIVRDDDGNDVMVCYTKRVSSSDEDAFAYLLPDSLANHTLVYTDITTSWSTPRVQCATTGFNPRKYAVAIDRNLSNFRVRVHLHDSNDFVLRTNVVHSNPNNNDDNDWRCDIGGAEPSTSRFTTTGRNFMLVWQRDRSTTPANTATSKVMGRTLSSSGSLGNEMFVGSSSLNDFDRPSITQQSFRTGSLNGQTVWMVVFQAGPRIGSNANNYWSVTGRLVTDTNDVRSGFNFGTSNEQCFPPQVAGNRGRYLVAFTHSTFAQVPFKTSSATGHDLYAIRVDWPYGSGPSTPHPMPNLSSQTTRRLELGGVAYDWGTRSHWALNWASVRSGLGTGTGRTFVSRLGYRGKLTETQVMAGPANSSESGEPGGITFDDDGQHFLASWSMNSSSAGRASVVKFIYPAVSPPVVSGTSCSTGTIDWSGPQYIGGQYGAVRLNAAPANQFALLLVALASQDLNLAGVGLPGCRLLVANSGPAYVGIASRVTNSGGNASVPLPLPEFLGNLDVYFQWFHTDNGIGGVTFVSTRRLRVPLVK